MNQHYVEILWSQFYQRIVSDWNDKYADFGDINDIQGQIKLCETIREDILSLQTGRKIGAPSKEAINIYLNQGGFGRPKQKTLEIFVDYLGYSSIQDFIDKNEVEEYTTMDEQPVSGEEVKMVKPPFYKNLWVMIPLLLVFSFLFYYFNKTETNFRALQEEYFADLIEQANSVEFQLYKDIPNLADTNKIREYYAEEPAKDIINRLKGLIEKGYVLDQEESVFRVTAKPVFTYLGNERATVETAEYWKIVWNKDGEMVHKYDHVNQQKYIIINEEGKWKILVNEYAGEAQVKENKK